MRSSSRASRWQCVREHGQCWTVGLHFSSRDMGFPEGACGSLSHNHTPILGCDLGGLGICWCTGVLVEGKRVLEKKSGSVCKEVTKQTGHLKGTRKEECFCRGEKGAYF